VQIVKQIPPSILQGVCSLLGDAVPAISPTRLVAALRAHADDQQPVRQKLLNTNEAAKILGLSPFTVRRWCREGKLPTVVINTRHRIRQSDLMKLVEGQEVA